MPLVWDSKLDTGIEVIDAQHRRIVAYVNHLEVAKTKGDKSLVGDVIEQLVDYTQSHFSFEEAMMEEAGYKFLKPHQKVHELFIRRVTGFTMRAAKGEEVADELHAMLTTWLLNHIASEDHDYAASVRQMMSQKDSEHDVVPGKGKGGVFAALLNRFFR
jgi:hemerythrin